MEVFSNIEDIRRHRRKKPGESWGLVPTMGFLHEGHLSLVHRAREENEKVGVSIFVNPIQFSNPNDLTAYPRDLDRDLDLLEREGADLVWTPDQDIMYNTHFQTYIDVEEVAKPLEGVARPGHFRGVATVVAKLFNVFEPRRAYFGQKDAQQAVVIQRMVRDLNFNLEVIVCPTIREPDGLAMSSRNVNLSPTGRDQSTCLYRALSAARTAFNEGQRNAAKLRKIMLDVIEAAEGARVDYVSVAHPETLLELEIVENRALCSVAVIFDEVRLIDNLIIGSGGRD
jgi:pantoate--beta-alanine ligase